MAVVAGFCSPSDWKESVGTVGRWEAQGEKTDPHAVRQCNESAVQSRDPVLARHVAGAGCCRQLSAEGSKSADKSRRKSPGPGALRLYPRVTKCRRTTPSIHCECDRRGRPQYTQYGTRLYNATHPTPVQLSTSRTLCVPYSHGRLFDVVPRLSTWCLALAPTAQRPLRPLPSPRTTAIGPYTAISGHAWSIAPQGPPSPACAHLTRGRRGRRGRLAPGRRGASGSRVPARRSRQ